MSAKPIERLHVDRVEAFADTKQKDSDHDEGNENRKCNADFDDKRHAFGPGRRKHEAVFQRHETDHLAHRIAPRHHHQQTKQKDAERESESMALVPKALR